MRTSELGFVWRASCSPPQEEPHPSKLAGTEVPGRDKHDRDADGSWSHHSDDTSVRMHARRFMEDSFTYGVVVVVCDTLSMLRPRPISAGCGP